MFANYDNAESFDTAGTASEAFRGDFGLDAMHGRLFSCGGYGSSHYDWHVDPTLSVAPEARAAAVKPKRAGDRRTVKSRLESLNGALRTFAARRVSHR